MKITKTVYWQNALAACIGSCVLPFALAASDADQKLSPTAKEFAAKGAQTVLAQCDLPKRKCNDKPLKVRSADSGESDGEKKSFETLTAPGMETMVIFAAAMRSKYEVSTVTLSNADWPDVNGIKVGMERAVVVQALGEPNSGTKNSCDAYFDEDSDAVGYVCYSAGKVTRIRWEYSVD
jgi:hypothetical protein